MKINQGFTSSSILALKIKAKCGKLVSAPATSIKRYRRRLRYRYRRVKLSPYMNDYHKLLRFLWCKRHEHDDFQNHIFVDETKIVIGSIPMYHWRRQKAYPNGIPNSVKFRLKVNVWGGLSSKGLTRFSTFRCNMNAPLFKEIIEENLIPFAAGNFDDFTVHQDNDPKHTAKETQKFWRINKIKCVKAPPQSPDLNPVEMLWSELKRYVDQKFCKSYEEVLSSIEEFRLTVTPSKCRRYIKHLKKVIKIVIEKEGGYSNH